MPIFSIAPLTSPTPTAPLTRSELAAEALARVAMIQASEDLGAMIGQAHSDAPDPTQKSTVGEGEPGRAKAAEAHAAINAAALPDTPARAVGLAAGRAAARQGGLAPLMADMVQAAAEPGVPRPVKAAIDQVLSLTARMDGQISAPEIRQALQRSGLFLEARLAAASPGDTAQRPPTGTLTAPPKLVPTPTPNSDIKAALLVFREVVKTWMDAVPPAAAVQTPAAAPPASPHPVAALGSAQVAEREASPALAQPAPTTSSNPGAISRPLTLDPVERPSTPVELEPDRPEPAIARPGPAPSPPAARPTAPPLPAFGAIVADDFPALPMVAARPRLAAVAAYGGPEGAAGPPSETPPPYAGAPTHAQAAAKPGLPPGADPHAVAHRLLAETGAALARTELLQIASLPDAPVAGRGAEESGARWVFDMPFMTPQGPSVAQFEISRDGGGGGGEGERRIGRTWRARFSLDVEPMGPVHAQVALTGDRARVSLWAERPASMARLRGGEDRLNAALREAALEPELAFHPGQPRAAAAAPGQFLDQAT
ncbi:flagellar hook-length control protein FliK [Caulobacter sp. LARHSG274]